MGETEVLIGEMCALIAATFIMIGLAKGITARLYVNDFIACFLLFVIVLLNVRGGIEVRGYSLRLGGMLSAIVAWYIFLRRSETAKDVFTGLLSALVTAGLVMLYFIAELPVDAKWIVPIAALPVGAWCAVSANRTFATCLFSALFGAFLGGTLHAVFIAKGGAIGGGYAFGVMWLGAVVGLFLQYLFTIYLSATGNPRASSLFEAGEMKESEENRK